MSRRAPKGKPLFVVVVSWFLFLTLILSQRHPQDDHPGPEGNGHHCQGNYILDFADDSVPRLILFLRASSTPSKAHPPVVNVRA